MILKKEKKKKRKSFCSGMRGWKQMEYKHNRQQDRMKYRKKASDQSGAA